jgi:hypothetical protein
MISGLEDLRIRGSEDQRITGSEDHRILVIQKNDQKDQKRATGSDCLRTGSQVLKYRIRGSEDQIRGS